MNHVRHSPHSHLRYDRHTGRQQVFYIRGLNKDDLYRHTLYYLYVVASGVLRRQQTELRSSPRLNTIDTSLKDYAVKGINVDVHRLSRLYSSYLILFKVRGHPDLARDDGHQGLTNLDQCASFDRFICDSAGLRSVDLGIRELEFCLRDRGL